MLIGVGLGPGDPGLLTLRAVQALTESDRVFVPGEIAAGIVKPYCKPTVLEFPMTRDREILEASWEKAALVVATAARDGLAAFGALGDPNFFATFTHLRRIIEKTHPEIEVKTIPGVSAITAFASRVRVAIDTSFEVDAGTPTDVRIVLKASRPKEIVARLSQNGFEDFILIENLSRENEKITHDQKKMPQRAAYLSTLYARRK